MFSFFETIFSKVVSTIASVIIAVGLISAPTEQLTTPLQNEVQENIQTEVKDADDFQVIKTELEAEKKKRQQLEQKFEQEKKQRAAEQANLLELQRQQEPKRNKEIEEARLLELQNQQMTEEVRKQQEQERLRQLEELKRQQGAARQEEITKQAELEREKQLYQQRQQELNNLISWVNRTNQQKLAIEQDYRVQEGAFITTYCKKKEDELNDNYGARGLYMSGMRIQAVEELRITCPTEARNVFNAYMNDELYPFVVQLEDMKRQFQEYNRDLYSACSRVSYDCSIYLNAAFPVNF